MLNQLSVFLAIILIFLGGKWFHGIHGHDQQSDSKENNQTDHQSNNKVNIIYY